MRRPQAGWGGGLQVSRPGETGEGGKPPSPSAPPPKGIATTVQCIGIGGKEPDPVYLWLSPYLLRETIVRVAPHSRLPTGYPHALPPPPGRGTTGQKGRSLSTGGASEEREARAGWGGFGERTNGYPLVGGGDPLPGPLPPMAISTTVHCYAGGAGEDASSPQTH